jgi:hypothetical protein
LINFSNLFLEGLNLNSSPVFHAAKILPSPPIAISARELV